jgi:sulfonate transport system substrate-binding protein
MANFRGGAAICGMILALGAASARAEEPVKIRIAWTTAIGQLGVTVFRKTDVLAHYGKSYVVDPVYYKGSGPQITALAAGELDIAIYAPNALALSVENAHIDDARVIGDGTRDGHADFNSRKYMVQADSPIRTVEDLKGKVLATNSLAGAMDTAMRVMLKKHGLEDKRDYRVVELDFPNMFAAVTSAKVDLASISLPFSIGAEKSGKVRTLFTMRDAIGESDMSIMTTRAPFIAQHRAALVDFFADMQRGLRWFYDPKNRGQVLDIIAAATKQPPSAYADWLLTKKDDYRDPAVRPSLAAVQADIDRQVQLGFLKTSIDVKTYADLSLVEEAAKRTR